MVNYNRNIVSFKLFLLLPCLLFSLILLSSITLASTGCFLNKDSDLFCQPLSLVDAMEECNYVEDCNILTDFITGQVCSELEVCELILCKSSCELNYLGRCSQGEVPVGEIDDWCSGGCCKFSTNTKKFCQIEKNKQSCGISASNKGVSEISWDIFKDESECINTCDILDTVGLTNFEFINIDFSLPLLGQTSEDEFNDSLSDLITPLNSGPNTNSNQNSTFGISDIHTDDAINSLIDQSMTTQSDLGTFTKTTFSAISGLLVLLFFTFLLIGALYFRRIFVKESFPSILKDGPVIKSDLYRSQSSNSKTKQSPNTSIDLTFSNFFKQISNLINKSTPGNLFPIPEEEGLWDEEKQRINQISNQKTSYLVQFFYKLSLRRKNKQLSNKKRATKLQLSKEFNDFSKQESV